MLLVPPAIEQTILTRLTLSDCGNTILNGGPAPDGNAGCRMTCNGNQTEFCGGPNRMNFYQIDVPPPPPTTGWLSQGCYTDAGAGARTLAINGIIPGGPSAMAHEACYLSCGADGYIYSGTEYSGECCKSFLSSPLRSQGPKANFDRLRQCS